LLQQGMQFGLGLYTPRYGASSSTTNVSGGGSGLTGIAGVLGGLGQLGTGLPSLISGIGSLFSSRDFKNIYEEIDAEKLLREISRMPIYRWRYRKGFGDGGEHIGPVVEEMPAEMVKGKSIDVISALGALMGMVKVLSRKVEMLEKANA
jgi:hypothetical protein